MAPQPKAKKKRKTHKPNPLQSRSRLDWRIAVVFLVLAVLIGGLIYFTSRAGTSSYRYDAVAKKPTGRMFTDDSPLNQPIPTNVRYKADSATRLSAARLPAAISLFEWSVPVFDVDASTPKVNIWCYLTDIQASWDTCNGLNLSPQPIPAGVFAQRGGDGHLLIVDNSARTITNYWIWKDCFLTFNLNNAKWCPASGNKGSIDGNGVGGGANVAKLTGGIIRTYEIEQGYIDHAITFSSANTCKGEPVYPALNSDGTTTDQSSCIPIGSRIQLDPTINVDALPSITPMEKMIAKALQKYGAYADDTGGIFGFGVEFDRTGRKVYQKAGAPEFDHFSLKGIPWDKVKILEPQWKRDGTKAYAWGGTSTTSSTTPTTTTTTTSNPTTTPTSSTTSTPSPAPICDPAAKTPCTSPAPSPTPGVDTVRPSTPAAIRSSISFDNLAFDYFARLSWTSSIDNVGVTQYEVKRNGISLGTTKTPEFKDYNLEPNTLYSYDIYAKDAAGNVSLPGNTRITGKCFLVWCWAE